MLFFLKGMGGVRCFVVYLYRYCILQEMIKLFFYYGDSLCLICLGSLILSIFITIVSYLLIIAFQRI